MEDRKIKEAKKMIREWRGGGGGGNLGFGSVGGPLFWPVPLG